MARDMERVSLSAQTKFMACSAEKRTRLMALMTELVEANNEFSRAPTRGSHQPDK